MVAISLLCPLVMLVCGSFMKLFGFFHIPAPYTLDHWREVLDDPIFFSSLSNSLMLSVGAGLGGVLFYAVVAYLIVRSPLPGRAHCRSARLAAVVDSRTSCSACRCCG